MSSEVMTPVSFRFCINKDNGKIVELFDTNSYLFMCDQNRKLTGVITSDDIISLLRAQL